jgi:thioredoxin 2
MTDLISHVVCPACSAINRIPDTRSALQAKCGTCHNPIFNGRPTDVDTKLFDRHRTRNDIPVVVDFWASWCGPCMAMAPAYQKAAAGLEPHFRLLKVNADNEQPLLAKFGIRSIPTMILFSHGTPVAQTGVR